MKIGFIGLGIMGESMCENIVKKHDDKVYVFDFVEAKVKQLEAVGAGSMQQFQGEEGNMQMSSFPWCQSQSIPEVSTMKSFRYWMPKTCIDVNNDRSVCFC